MNRPSPVAPARLRPICCAIVPLDVLRRFARDPSLDEATRQRLRDSCLETERLRGLREAHRIATLRDPDRHRAEVAAHVAAQHLFDCKQRKTLPGAPVARPTAGFKTTFDATARLIEFYRTVLGRNSVDGKGMDLVSSLHYAKHYDNAFWNGQQMVYGDGDGQLFGPMYLAPDVIGHEVTHGITQNESALRYEGESGALNESLSDVFGAVFHQWLNQWNAAEPRGWLIGAGIIAPPAHAKGYSCLRDMARPSAAHCLAPQPERYGQIDPTADVHDNSGVPNKAFANFARALGGPAWQTAIMVWYDACTRRRLRSDATFQEFAAATLASAQRLGGSAAADACRAAWAGVGLPEAAT